MKPPTVILAVDDVARSAKFYQDVFGWPVRMDAGVIVELELPGGDEAAYFADPDGNVVAVARPWPAARLSAPAGGRP